MRSVVYLTNLAPSKLADELTTAGYQVFDALSVSEVLHLCEHQTIDAIVIAPEMQEEALLPLRQKQITISLKPNASSAEVIWELSNLFGHPAKTVQ